MSKLKQSVAIQRQIPEHIRENYPVFVEFIKLYYDFLQQTQAQELEKIRSIDTTLDEFIDKFKSELSRNMPVELAGDKRLLLKHIREFYLSRGSEASYKFLFRTLFGKEATLFYPSTQVLRVSDGHWKQDVSIFVQLDAVSLANIFDITDADISGLSGKFFTIKSGNKTIQAYAEQVLRYNQSIFEVFIQRDYANDIVIGATIQYDDPTYGQFGGTVVACPSKISIYKSGKGFEVGQLYSLKTNIGRGCVVKITKVDSVGAIKAVQVVSFGLDYQSTFYSYLSNKTLGAFEYVHPIHINTGTAENPATPPGYDPDVPSYNEGYSGFLDYGFASRQEYFYYDTDIPVGTADRNSDRFFADPSYVGDIVQQFYNNSDGKVMDDDLAIIQIDLGAVARYPGYYLNANGFVSDEMYLHDGRYYQAFSYVIRVEEELRKYADIVKALIHPAGMKGYSEYSIFKQLDVRAVMPALSQLIQFSDVMNELDDRGYSWSSYDEHTIDGEVTYVPSAGANKVYSRQGKVATFPIKKISDILLTPESRLNLSEKAISDAITNTVAKTKGLSKNASDVLTDYLETLVFGYIKSPTETVNGIEARSFLVETIKEDVQLLIDTESFLLQKPFDDAIISPSDVETTLFFKNIYESVTYDEVRYSEMAKVIADNPVVLVELLSNSAGKIFSDSTDSTPDVESTQLEKYMAEALDQPDLTINEWFKNLADAVIQIVDKSKPYDKNISDAQVLLDILSNSTEKIFSDINDPILDDFSLARFKAIDDLQSLFDQYLGNSVEKNISETVTLDRTRVKEYEKPLAESIDLIETTQVARAKFIDDLIDSINDVYLNELTKNFSETPSAIEDYNKENSKAKTETINISIRGRIRLAPYDLESYFYAFDDYQTATTLS